MIKYAFISFVLGANGIVMGTRYIGRKKRNYMIGGCILFFVGLVLMIIS